MNYNVIKQLKLKQMNKYNVLLVDSEFDDFFEENEMYPLYEIQADSIEEAWEEMRRNYSDCESCDEETHSIMDHSGLVYMLQESK